MIEEYLKIISDLFVSRTDSYAQQQGSGKYFRVEKPLDNSKLKKHIAGSITLGVYQLNKEDKVKWCCYDLDCSEGNEHALHHAANLLKDRGLHYGIQLHTEDSGRKGYHLWIFFAEPVSAKKAYKLCHGLLGEVRDEMPEAVNVEVFPKQIGLKGGYGSLVKLPIGIHRATGRRCLFLDENFSPYENEDKSGYGEAQIDFLKNVKRMTPESLDNVIDEFPEVNEATMPYAQGDRPDLAYSFVDEPVATVYRYCSKLREMRETAEQEGHLTNEERLILAGIMINLPGGAEEIHRVMACCKDFSEIITQKNIDYLTRKGASPFSCTFICGCENIKARKGISPIAFAYKTGRK